MCGSRGEVSWSSPEGYYEVEMRRCKVSAAHTPWLQDTLSPLILPGEPTGGSHLAPGDPTTCAASGKGQSQASYSL